MARLKRGRNRGYSLERVFSRLADVQDDIPHGALLLRRPGGWWLSSRLIAHGGRGDYCHAMMAAWTGGELRCLHTQEFRGGREESLADLVKRAPGKIDVFAPNTELFRSYRPLLAVAAMREIVGHRYGWWAVLRVSLSHLAVIRLFVPTVTDDKANGRYPPHCSGAISRACTAGGVDPVLRLPAYLTEPGDLARSHLFSEYLFTLVP